MKLRTVHAASRELDEAAIYYSLRSTKLAQQFLEAVEAANDEVSKHPLRRPLFDGRSRRLHVAGFPYSVIYRVRSNEIFIVAYAHAKRRPGYWKDRGG